jgi:oligopeptide transport system permease protein
LAPSAAQQGRRRQRNSPRPHGAREHLRADLSPHPYDRVYPQYVRVPASLEAYPREDRIIPAFESALARARVEIGEVEVDGSTVRVTVSDDEPIDPRIVRYVDRSDLFDNGRIEGLSADGRTAMVIAHVTRVRFVFGTDGNGRDLLTRILIGMRISLAIGLLASIMALFLGVPTGRSRAMSAGGSMAS